MPRTEPEPLAQGLEWDHGALIVTSDALLDKIDKPYLSASTADAMRSCPARWLGEKALPEAVDLFAANSLGTAAHTVLERLYDLPGPKRTQRAVTGIIADLQAEYQATFPGHLDDPITADRWKEEVSRRAQGIFTIEDPTAVVSVYRERRLDGIVLPNGVPFKGFIDHQTEVVVKRSGKAKIGARLVDFKAGKCKPAGQDRFGKDPHGDQLRLYSAAVKVLDGEAPLEAYVYYITHGKTVKVPLGPKFMEPTLDAFGVAWRDLREFVEDRAFPVRTSPLCGWCPLVNACPTAQADGKCDRLGTAPSAEELGIASVSPAVDSPAADEDEAETEPGGYYTGWDASDPPDDIPEEGVEMSTSTRSGRPWREAKPWEGAEIDGHLSLNSFAATAVFGTVTLAVEVLHEAAQPVTPATVRALSSLFGRVVMDAQAEVTDGDHDWQAGANTRLRGALRTVVSTIPLPWGWKAEIWEDWQAKATRRCVSIANAALDLYEDGPMPGYLDVLDAETDFVTVDGQLPDLGPLSSPQK